MSPSQVSSVVTDAEAQAASLAIRLVALAETIELVARADESGVERDQVLAALDAFARVGVGRHSAALGRRLTAARLVDALQRTLVAIEESPLPAYEWRPLTKVLGDEPLAQLVGTSVSSVHRYRAGERPTPDDIAARLHAVALMAADLGGSYNEFGIRRWFQRGRSALGGASPSAVLAGEWSPDDEGVKEVRALARALLCTPAT